MAIKYTLGSMSCKVQLIRTAAFILPENMLVTHNAKSHSKQGNWNLGLFLGNACAHLTVEGLQRKRLLAWG